MVGRALAVPAVVCLLAGAALGVWGWGARDEARARILPGDPFEEDGFFTPSSEPDPLRTAGTCELLLAASRLEAPGFGVFGGPDPTGIPSTTPSSIEVAASLIALLDPRIVQGVDGLDRIDVQTAIAFERDALESALNRGVEITTDPQVRDAASDLERALDGSC